MGPAAGAATADFSPLERPASHFDPQRSKITARTMYSDEYLNPDGTHTVREATQPLNVQDAKGVWQPIDTTLTTDGTRDKATRHP